MKKIGVIGLGDMGLGMARNLLKAGFAVTAFDLRPERVALAVASGATAAADSQSVGESSEAVFVMVLNGEQADAALFGDRGLAGGLRRGSVVILTSTVSHQDAARFAEKLADHGVDLIDTPVAGGRWAADAAELILILSGPDAVVERCREPLDAVSQGMVKFGDEPGKGQTAKAVLQALAGATFGGIFEAMTLGKKAGIDGEKLYELIAQSGVGSPLFRHCGRLILDRKFEDSGSQLPTMYKDLSLTMALAREQGVPMFTVAASYELFQAGISALPGQDNWAIVKLLERLSGMPVPEDEPSGEARGEVAPKSA